MFYFFVLILLTIIFVKTINNYYKSKNKINNFDEDFMKRSAYEKLEKHLLENSKLSKTKKPILWIFIDFEKNARKWIDFGSKNSTNLNMPYIYLCLKTIIDNCGDSFHVVIIDQKSIANLIPGWNINLSKLSRPLKEKYINLAKLKILKNFGGVFVPPSFICKRDLFEIYYENCVYNKKMFCFEMLNKNDQIKERFLPKIDFFGCDKNNTNIDILINQYQEILAKDYTEESNFNEELSKILLNNSNIISIECGKLIGVKKNNSKPVLIEDIMSNKKLEISNNHYGLYIPYNDIKIRNKYNWFLYLSPIDVLNSQTFVGRYLNQSI